MKPPKAQRVVVLLREHVGDVVNSTPYIRALQDKYPDAAFVLDVGAGAAGVLENFPRVEEIWRRPTHEGLRGKLRYIVKLRRGKFDMAVILDDSSRFVFETWLARIPFRAGVFRKRFESLYSVSVPYSRDRHDLFDPLDELMRALDVPVSVSRPVLFPSPDDIETVAATLASVEHKGNGLIGLNASTGRHYNRWPSDRWAQVADALADQGYACVLFGAPQDQPFNEEIRAWTQSKPADWAGKLTLVQLYELMKKLKYVLTVDTGTVHLAAAAAAPTVVLYGPTDPKRFYPYGDRWIGVRSDDHRMASNTVQTVMEAFESLKARFP